MATMNINPDSAKEILCKNVHIYGFCKFENRGCAFAHFDPSAQSNKTSTKGSKSNAMNSPNNKQAISDAAQDQIPQKGPLNGNNTGDSAPKRRFNANTPSFQPSVQYITNKFSNLSPKLKEIPVFVPSGKDSPQASEAMQTLVPTRKFDASTPSFTPSFEPSLRFGAAQPTLANQTDSSMPAFSAQTMPSQSMMGSMGPQNAPPLNPYLQGPPSATVQQSRTMPAISSSGPTPDFMFHNGPSTLAFPLNHHLYAPAPPPRLAIPLEQHQTNANDMFIPNDLRELLTKKNEATLQTLPSLSLPDHVGIYHSLVPIDNSFEHKSKVYNVPSYVYKALSNESGLPYALRRIDYGLGLRILNELPFSTIKTWMSLKNPNVVRIQDAFSSMCFGTFGEPSLCMVYDYYPLSSTLQEEHLSKKPGGKLTSVTEDILWSYIIQITNALLGIHKAGLHAGSSLSLSKILVTNKNRIRLGAVAVDDILRFEEFERIKQQIGEEELRKRLIKDDCVKFSAIITELVNTTLPAGLRSTNPENVLAQLTAASLAHFSDEFIDMLRDLNKLAETSDIEALYKKHLALKALDTMAAFEDSADYMEGQLSSELENARLFRLMAKLNSLISLSEKEKRENANLFVISLFHQFVFNSHDELGRPVVDLSKILVNLNKLDVGVDEKILLVSRDEDNCIIVSYKEIKDLIELTFRNIYRHH